jgi:PAS domain S-box-containing protein
MIAGKLKKLQIRHKLIAINLMITGIVGLIASIVLLTTAFISFRNSMQNNLSSQALILAANSTASLTFNDQKAAAEMLSALASSSDIECAAIYARDGSVFATYQRSGEKEKLAAFPPPQKNGPFIAGNHLHIFQGIILDRERIGTIYIRSNLKRLISLMMIYGAASVVTFLAVFVIAYVLLSKWQKVITEPILDLSQVMNAVSKDRNYSLKANVYAEDEIGSLAQGFNEMLEQIRLRDTQLRTEIVERKRAAEGLRQAKEEWERTFDAIVDPVMIVDNEHKIIKVNKAMADKLGISPANAEGLACYNAVHGADEPPLLCPHTELLADGLTHSAEIYAEHLGGYYIVSVSPLLTSQGEVYGAVHYARDITERKQAEESVRRMNEELEQKIRERTKQLLDAQEELVRKEKLSILGQLSGSVGHELRNPLGVMSNAIYFLKMVHTDADETTKEYLDIIHNEINNSQRIITDLLDFARTKAPRRMTVMAGELLEESLKKCLLPENIDFQSDIPDTLPSLMVDPLQMGQVFQNIITNGIQAMSNGGAIRISARAVQSSEIEDQGLEENPEQGTRNYEPGRNFIEISVADSGEGILPENMEKLFQPLFTTKARGIGLGLTVCKNLTEANGGKIKVESEAGHGTTFTILLPVEG